MTAASLVRRWQWRLALASGAGALLVVAGVAAGLWGMARVLGSTLPSVLALAVALGAGLGWWWRTVRGTLGAERVALWIEERVPQMQYALLSAQAPGLAGEWARTRVARTPVAGAWTGVRRALRVPVGIALSGALVALLPLSLTREVGNPVGAGPGARPPGAALASLTVRVVPPAYTRRAVQVLDNPSQVRPMAGSRLELSGQQGESPVTAQAVGREVGATVDAGRWSVAWRADTLPQAITLRSGSEQRLLLVEPVVDSAPVVSLESPGRDTVFRTAEGRVLFRARARDDLGLASAAFEYIVSSGEGERFTFRSGTLGEQAPAGKTGVDLEATADLRALQLQPGDVVHVRAVATDLNNVSGPGRGASETRTLRVARTGEYDSVAVDAAPPAQADSALLSQRMIINLTEALVRRERRLSREVLLQETRRLSRDQGRLRKAVSDVVFSRLGDQPAGEHFHGDGHDHDAATPVGRPLTPEELLKAAERATSVRGEALDFAHDETPVVAVNRPLLEAYNAMWDAGRSLDAGEPRAALPPMYVALAAIQRARAAERLYLRGAAPRVVVDLPKVRLQGKGRGGDAVVEAPLAVPPPLRALWTRTLRAMRDAPGAGADSLLLLRLDVVATHPDLAAALDTLAGDVRGRREATRALLALRRAMGQRATVRSLPSPWLGGQ